MEMTLGRRSSGPLAVVVVALVAGLFLAYLGGVIQTLGYEKRHVTFSGYASGSKSGGGFGLKHMLFFEGQTFFAQYDATVRDGALRIGILETFGPIGGKPHHVESISSSRTDEVVYRIPKTGIYSIYFEGSVLGETSGRYDVSYSVHWGAR